MGKKLILTILVFLLGLFIFNACTSNNSSSNTNKKGDINQEQNIFDNTLTIKEQVVSLKCNSDEECILINKDLGFSCCWEGACEEIDYSLDRYVAVNQDSFHSLRIKECPWVEDKAKRYEKCGPAPGCPVALINDNFVAKCVNNICTKAPK